MGAAAEKSMGEGAAVSRFDPTEITRPDPALLTYYLLVSMLTLLAFPVTFVRLYVRYRTLRYRFDNEGIGMSWGLLFRREVYLTYRRIQDIHVTRNILHRWLGLASVEIQTASGSASAEMALEGILEPERLRDFLYLRMRGAREDHAPEEPAGREDEALRLLRNIRDELRRLRARGEAGP